MSQKGVSFVAYLLIVFVSIASGAVAQAPQDLYASGMQAARRSEYPQALQYLHRAIDLHPEFAKAHAALGTIYLQLGDFPASEEALTRALHIAPGLMQAESNLALLYAKTERFDDAIRVYRNLTQKHPESLSVWLGIASAYQKADQFEEAIAAYHESLKRSPSHPTAMTNLASCYEAVKQQERAIQYYKAALVQAPNLPMANGNLGAIYQKQGELDKALPLLEKAVRYDPQFTAARYCLGLVLTKKHEFQRAAMEYQRVISQQNDHVGAYYNLAQALFRLKQPEEGKRAMEIYRQLNAIAQEIDDRERAILIEPNNPLKQYQLGLVYAKHGKIDKGILAFQAALELDANAHYALNALARLYILKNIQLQDAITHAEKAFHLTQAPQYMQTLALAYFQAGKREEALKAIQTAVEMEPENEAFQRTLTRMREANEKTK